MSTKKILKRKRDFDGRFVKFFKKCIRNSLHLPYAFCNQLENRTAMTTLFFLLPQFNSFSLIIWFLLITISLYIINLHKYTSCQYEHRSMGSDVFGEQKPGSGRVRIGFTQSELHMAGSLSLNISIKVPISTGVSSRGGITDSEDIPKGTHLDQVSFHVAGSLSQNYTWRDHSVGIYP